MRPSLVGSMRQVFSLTLIFVGVFAGRAGQFDTGKIEGKVRDQAGVPIPNAQVTIVGTAFGALTNWQGYYLFNNVPVGTVSVRAAFVGYKSKEVQGIRILSGQTVTQDIRLEASPFQADEITITTAGSPLVPRDQVTTGHSVIPHDRAGCIPKSSAASASTVGIVDPPHG